jgi:hypothetical protein
VSLPCDSKRFFGVYDHKGRCIAVGSSSNNAVEAARKRLDWNTGQEVMNAHSVVQIGTYAYVEHLKRL